jgi:hypothetical protein
MNMAHYAELDENNIVLQVIVGVDEPLDGEAIYQQETGRVWKKTSYNTHGNQHLLGGTPFRKNYAGVGYTYDPDRDAFIPPKNYPSWTLDEETCNWFPPVPRPNDGNFYIWVEEARQWITYTPFNTTTS